MDMTGLRVRHCKDSIHSNWQAIAQILEREEKGRNGYSKQVRGVNIQLHQHPSSCFLYLPKTKANLLELCL